MINKKEAEPNILWRLHSGTSSFWWDNWLGIGPLANFRNEGDRPGNMFVSQFWDSGRWNILKLNACDPSHKIPKILQVPIKYSPHTLDKPIWTLNPDGNFTCASAWGTIRKRIQVLFTNTMTWHKQLSFKLSFCLWIALRNKLPTDNRVVFLTS